MQIPVVIRLPSTNGGVVFFKPSIPSIEFEEFDFLLTQEPYATIKAITPWTGSLKVFPERIGLHFPLHDLAEKTWRAC